MITRLVRQCMCHVRSQLTQKQIVFTVSTGVFTSICAIASLVSVRRVGRMETALLLNNRFRFLLGGIP